MLVSKSRDLNEILLFFPAHPINLKWVSNNEGGPNPYLVPLHQLSGGWPERIWARLIWISVWSPFLWNRITVYIFPKDVQCTKSCTLIWLYLVGLPVWVGSSQVGLLVVMDIHRDSYLLPSIWNSTYFLNPTKEVVNHSNSSTASVKPLWWSVRIIWWSLWSFKENLENELIFCF